MGKFRPTAWTRAGTHLAAKTSIRTSDMKRMPWVSNRLLWRNSVVTWSWLVLVFASEGVRLNKRGLRFGEARQINSIPISRVGSVKLVTS